MVAAADIGNSSKSKLRPALGRACGGKIMWNRTWIPIVMLAVLLLVQANMTLAPVTIDNCAAIGGGQSLTAGQAGLAGSVQMLAIDDKRPCTADDYSCTRERIY